LACQSCLQVGENPPKHWSFKRVPQVDNQGSVGKCELRCIAFDRVQVLALLRRTSIARDVCYRNCLQLGDSSTPTIARNGYSEAINSARPLPDPRSLNVYFWKSRPSCRRTCRSAEGATPKYPALYKSFRFPLARSSGEIRLLVSTPNCWSNGCIAAYFFGKSNSFAGGRATLLIPTLL
jgi:hypothetical protein